MERHEEGAIMPSKFIPIVLNLFDGEDSGSEGGTGESVSAQTSPANSGAAGTDEESRAEQYSKFKTDFKDLFDAEIKGILNDRFKKSKETEKQLKAFSTVGQRLSEKYGVDGNNPEEILKALDEDDSFYEEEAMEKGMPVDELKKSKALLRENNALKEEMAERNRQETIDKQVSEWMRQAQEAQKIYPQLNFESELKNERFRSLLQTPGITVRDVYEIVHRDEIMPAYTQFVEQKAQKAVADSVRANGQRPKENALNNSAPAKTKSDPSTWSKEELEDVSRRVQRGEKIKL